MHTRINKIVSFILTILILFSFVGCFKEESEFPVVTFPEDSTSSSDTNIDSDVFYNDDFHEITVALPLSEDTVNYLLKLYYAKTNNMFPENQNGFDISLEYLNAISTPWVVHTITTTGQGEAFDAIYSMSQDSSVPDLFLTSDMIRLNNEGLIVPLNTYLANCSFITSSMYLGALEAMLIGNEYLGLPFYSTVMMIAGNKDYTPDEGIPPFSMTSEELRDYVNSIPTDGGVVPVYNPNEFNSYLGEEFFANEYVEGDARITRNCGIWLMDSGEFDTWSSYYPNGLYFTMLPTQRVHATTYPLSVSSTSSEIEFSVQFASFLCFDKDAQMLIHRLEDERGYFPSISNPTVWEILSSDSEFGSQAMLYEQFLDEAIYRLPED